MGYQGVGRGLMYTYLLIYIYMAGSDDNTKVYN